jgi:3-oxoacyl-[acyl-carrier-protein] synthase II
MGASNDPGRRVVVTGMGCVTPLGASVDETWAAAIEGRSGVRLVDRFDTEGYSCRIAAPSIDELTPPELSVKELRRTDRSILLALLASREALLQSGLEVDDSNRDRIGVAIGSGIGPVEQIIIGTGILREKGPRRVPPYTIPLGISSMPTGLVSIHNGLRGPSLCHVSACASSGHGIGESAKLIERGQADVMLAGGTEAPIMGIALAGFGSMKALSTRNDEPERASRPFDLGRDGFVMAEGAGVLVLEEFEHAKARGAKILGEVLGYGATSDATHVVAPDPEGGGATRCMQAALADAGLPPEAIGHVNAHATSTPAGDPVEVLALRNVFGSSLDSLPVSATKSMTGHLLGAAGAVEAIFSILAMRNGLLPPTINLDDPDPECALDHVRNKARAHAAEYTISNSFGFGGTNVALIFGLGDH